MMVGDARFIPFRDGSVDGVLCSEVIEHVFEVGDVIREIHRVLRPGGVLLLTTPFAWGLHYEPYDYWRFTPYSLRRLLEDRGFVVREEVKVGGLFSYFGSRIVEGVALQLWRRWFRGCPPKLRHGTILLFTVPASLLFYSLGRLLDRFIPTDYIGNAIVAVKAGR